MGKVALLTNGVTLAVGDLRALLGAIMTATKVNMIEQEARMTHADNEQPLCSYFTALGKALNDMYQTPDVTYQSIKFKIKPGETAAAYLHRCEQDWEEQTGEHRDSNRLCREFYRQAVMKGVPPAAVAQMEDSPDMVGGNIETWVRHIVHHVDRAVEKAGKDDSEIDKLKTQLLKLQIEAEKDKNKKKPARDGNQMVVQPNQLHGYPFDNMPYVPQPAPFVSPRPTDFGRQHRQGYVPYDPYPDWPPMARGRAEKIKNK